MSKSERELLELAAKAAGLDFEWSACTHCGIQYIPKGRNYYVDWMPLTDDGDALRLAVKLNLLHGRVFARGVAKHHRDGDDIYAATRRAIVLAAAEIGRELP